MIDADRWEFFTYDEFACACGDCVNRMDATFIDVLDDLRRRCGFPFVVTSGYRCPDYNDRIASTGRDGPHTTGRAVDIALSGPNVHRLVMQVSLGGWMSGIGLKQKGEHSKRFVHMDDLAEPDHPRPRVWTY